MRKGALALSFISICSVVFGAPPFEEMDGSAEAVKRSLAAEEEPMLLLTGKLFPVDLMGGELTFHGVPLFIKETPNSGEGTGHTVWDASVVLAKYMEFAFAPLLPGKTALELGAGTGVVGLAASILGASKVYLTDLEYTLDNIRQSVALNKASLHGAVEIRELDWFKPDTAGIEDIDYIFAADVVWVEELIEPLVSTMKLLTDPPTDASGSPLTDGRRPAEIVLAHQTRSKAGDALLFGLLKQHFDVKRVDFGEHHPEFRDEIIDIFRITRRWEESE